MVVLCKLTGGDINLEFPMTMRSFTIAMSFELKKVAGGRPVGISRHNFDPMNINFGLITDDILDSDFKMGIKNPSDLIDRCKDIYKAAIPPRSAEAQGAIIGHPLILTISDWYVAEGFITNVSIEFNSPWDERGRPHAADVTLMYEPVMVVRKENAPDGTYRRVFREEFNSFKEIKSKR